MPSSASYYTSGCLFCPDFSEGGTDVVNDTPIQLLPNGSVQNGALVSTSALDGGAAWDLPASITQAEDEVTLAAVGRMTGIDQFPKILLVPTYEDVWTKPYNAVNIGGDKFGESFRASRADGTDFYDRDFASGTLGLQAPSDPYVVHVATITATETSYYQDGVHVATIAGAPASDFSQAGYIMALNRLITDQGEGVEGEFPFFGIWDYAMTAEEATDLATYWQDVPSAFGAGPEPSTVEFGHAPPSSNAYALGVSPAASEQALGYVAASGAAYSLQVVEGSTGVTLGHAASSGTAYPMRPNYLQNAQDFSLAPWEIGSRTTVEFEADTTPQGLAASRVQMGPDNGTYLRQDISMEPGIPLRLGFWAKAATLDRLVVKVQDLDTNGFSEELTLTDEYVYYEFEMSAPGDPTRVSFDNGGVFGQGEVDAYVTAPRLVRRWESATQRTLGYAAQTSAAYPFSVEVVTQVTLGYAASDGQAYPLHAALSPTVHVLGHAPSTSQAYGLSVVAVESRALGYAVSVGQGYPLQATKHPAAVSLGYVGASSSAHPLAVQEAAHASLGYAASVGQGHALRVAGQPAAEALGYAPATGSAYPLVVQVGTPDAESVSLGHAPSSSNAYVLSASPATSQHAIGYAPSSSQAHSLAVEPAARVMLGHAVSSSVAHSVSVHEVVPGADSVALGHASASGTTYALSVTESPGAVALGHAASGSLAHGFFVGEGFFLGYAPSGGAAYPITTDAAAASLALAYAGNASAAYPLSLRDGASLLPDEIALEARPLYQIALATSPLYRIDISAQPTHEAL